MAASYYGVPRTTLDIDFLVNVSEDELDEFLDQLSQCGLEVNKNRIRRQLSAGYNVLTLYEKASPRHADFIIETEKKLRKRSGTFLGLKTYYQEPQALILAKLRIIRATQAQERSQKDRGDIRAIMAHEKIDVGRLLRSAAREGTEEILRDILELARRAKRAKVENHVRPRRTRSKTARGRVKRSKWGKQTFLDPGEATFGG